MSVDRISSTARSRVMSRIRKTGNKSTEKRLRAGLVRAGVSGWRLHDRGIAGTPDFYFPKLHLAVFVDGCFWHGCPRCYRRPKSKTEYWDAKLARNKLRDKEVSCLLKRDNGAVIRVWEHDVALNLTGVVNRITKVLENRRNSKPTNCRD